jgi:hypothetical protein
MIDQFNPAEVLSAASDAIALRVGATLKHPHPLASHLTLSQIAFAAGAQARQPQAGEQDRAIMGRGMATADFSRVLADGVGQVTIKTYSSQAEHLRFCAVQSVQDFQPAALPALDTDISLEPLGENAEITQGYAFLTAGAAQVRLNTFGRAIVVSRQAVLNDEFDAIGKIFASLGLSGARLEARLVAAALESNPVLDDGAVVFHADHQNILADNLTGPNLGFAMALLRTQTTAAGNKADLAAKHLIVSPELEFMARQLIKDAGLDVQVSTLAYLPSGRWFLTADPAISPTIGVLRLLGAKTPLRVEQKRRMVEVDGAAVKVVADLGACLLSRTGIVRGGLVAEPQAL